VVALVVFSVVATVFFSVVALVVFSVVATVVESELTSSEETTVFELSAEVELSLTVVGLSVMTAKLAVVVLLTSAGVKTQPVKVETKTARSNARIALNLFFIIFP
jgi:hypothetical protein